MKKPTPMMAQYIRLKESQPGAILFFRLGDFYEMFAEDAEQAAPILDIALTQRNGIPMCGVPHHAAQTYLAKLLRAGRRVAICEQIGQSDSGLSDRRIVEIVTPGTIVDEQLLDHACNNYLVALADGGVALSLSWADLSTGELRTSRLPSNHLELRLRDEIQRLSPREIIVQESLIDSGLPVEKVLSEHPELVLNRYPDWHFGLENNYDLLCRHFNVVDLRSFGLERSDVEVRATGALLNFIKKHALHDVPHMTDIVVETPDTNLRIDEPTQRNLELSGNLIDGGREHTLLSTIDRTRTSVGARLLRRSLLAPLRNRNDIEERLDCVAALFSHQAQLSRLRSELDGFRDLERLTSRCSLGRSELRELLAISSCLQCAQVLSELLSKVVPLMAQELRECLSRVKVLLAVLGEALADEADGPAIKLGHSADLDRLQSEVDDVQDQLSEYINEVSAQTGISTLRLKQNRVLGYFFDITKANLKRVPETFIRRQSLAGSERFTTEHLMDLDARTKRAQAEREAIELVQLNALRVKVAKHAPSLLRLAETVARVDLVQSLASSATEHRFSRPTFVDDDILEIHEGRHPVVEAALPKGMFIPNSVEIGNPERVVLLTGPNMAGKSTYLRQAALIVIMSQMGSFVPAEQARLGIIDAVYCRVGASDNISRGESTFLVEMAETARILRLARPSSLVIMDEIGRGTGSDDGLAIARAVLKYLIEEVRAKTLFATHFLELTKLEHPHLSNRSMAVTEQGGDVVFLKTVVDGPADRSHGIHVARMAGIPRAVSDAAAIYLDGENGYNNATESLASASERKIGQAPLFQYNSVFNENSIIEELRGVDVSRLRPIDALNLLQEWQSRID